MPLPISVRLPLPETVPESDNGPPTMAARTDPFKATCAAIVAPLAPGPTMRPLVIPKLFPVIE